MIVLGILISEAVLHTSSYSTEQSITKGSSSSPAVEMKGAWALITAEQVTPIPTGITIGIVLHASVLGRHRGAHWFVLLTTALALLA